MTGKTSADRLGAIVKRGVHARVLSGKLEVKCAQQLVQCAKTFVKSIHVFEVKQVEIDREVSSLQNRWKKVKSISGIREMHCFKPSPKLNHLITARTSFLDNEKEIKIIIIFFIRFYLLPLKRICFNK